MQSRVLTALLASFPWLGASALWADVASIRLEDPFEGMVQDHCPFESYLSTSIEPLTPSGVPGIDTCFLINLDCRRGRRERCLSALAAQGIQPVRLSAVVGAKLPAEALQKLGLRWQPGMQRRQSAAFIDGERRLFMTPQPHLDVTWYLPSPNMGRGALGCWLSHLSALYTGWTQGLSRIWVLEDDFIFLGSASDVAERVRELDALVGTDGWDILYTDPDQRASENPTVPWPCQVVPTRPDCGFSRSLERRRLSPRLTTVSRRWGTCSMIVNRPGMDKILNFFRQHGTYGPYDWDIHLVPDLREFACTDFLVTNLIAKTSDIQGEIKRRGPAIEPGDDPAEVWEALGAGGPTR
jgi:GR25 family glycosyltransferase involved in LPS biosynthesis